MGKKILIGCPSVPGFGGASTSAYSLFKRMQADGVDVTYLNLIDENHEPAYRSSFGNRMGNPEGLENVYRCTVRRPFGAPQPEIAKRLIAVKPEVVLGVSQLAAYLLKPARPDPI